MTMTVDLELEMVLKAILHWNADNGQSQRNKLTTTLEFDSFGVWQRNQAHLRCGDARNNMT